MSTMYDGTLKMELLFLIVLILYVCVQFSNCQLMVNVRNNGGDIYRENIDANTVQDTIVLEFEKSDGTVVSHIIDGKNEIQIFRVVVLPEEDLGHNTIQEICFVLRFGKNEFISSDAMSKLRQKNPNTVRHPEEILPSETVLMDLQLNVVASHIISAHIGNFCSNAVTYTRSSDLHLLAQILNRDYSILQTITRPSSAVDIAMCVDVDFSLRTACLCRYEICVGWYPCGLKYCRGKDSTGRIVSYRCGIKTCRRCRRFEFAVSARHSCSWDFTDFRQLMTDVDLHSNVNKVVGSAGSSSFKSANDSAMLHRQSALVYNASGNVYHSNQKSIVNASDFGVNKMNRIETAVHNKLNILDDEDDV